MKRRLRDYSRYERNIFLTFVLNFIFSILEFIGAMLTNSYAVLSDAIHDFSDSIGIGISFFLEFKSGSKPDNRYTYGYRRYSIFGGLITSIILFIGATVIMVTSIQRIINPVDIDYSRTLIFAAVGLCFNIISLLLTRGGSSINQRAVHLHILGDTMSGIIILIGAIIMNFTNIKVLDAIMSVGVALFIAYGAIKNFKVILDVLLEKVPKGIDVDNIREHLLSLDGVEDVSHIHIWSIDGEQNCATMHLAVSNLGAKHIAKSELKRLGISHNVIETECCAKCCDKYQNIMDISV